MDRPSTTCIGSCAARHLLIPHLTGRTDAPLCAAAQRERQLQGTRRHHRYPLGKDWPGLTAVGAATGAITPATRAWGDNPAPYHDTDGLAITGYCLDPLRSYRLAVKALTLHAITVTSCAYADRFATRVG